MATLATSIDSFNISPENLHIGFDNLNISLDVSNISHHGLLIDLSSFSRTLDDLEIDLETFLLTSV